MDNTNKSGVNKKQRQKTVNEVKFRLALSDLLDNPNIATKVLLAILDKYVNDGTVYHDKWLNFNDGSGKAYYLNLYNDPRKVDVVKITDAQD